MNKAYPFLLPLLALIAGCSHYSSNNSSAWKNTLHTELQALGYKNWIVIADASFPYYNLAGVRTVLAPTETPEVLDSVINTIEETQHIRPIFYATRELRSLTNDQSPGIDLYRERLEKAFHGHSKRELDQTSLQRLLKGATNSHSVLIIKTQTSLPYSSVFIELDSGYWDRDSEKELRKIIKTEEAVPTVHLSAPHLLERGTPQST